MWLPPVTIAPPQGEIVPLAVAKEYLRVDGDAFDLQLQVMIAAAIADVERITSTRLLMQTVRLGAPSFTDLATFPIGPVREISRISYLDQQGATADLDPDVYELVTAGLVASARPTPGARWPAIRPGVGSVSIEAIVGYGDVYPVPPNVILALFFAIRAAFINEPVDLTDRLANDRIWL